MKTNPIRENMKLIQEINMQHYYQRRKDTKATYQSLGIGKYVDYYA